MSTDVVIERHWDPPLSEADLFAMFSGAEDCLAMHRCVWQSSWLSIDGHELSCHFRCPDAESLRIAMHQAGSPRGRVWVSTVHDAPGCGPVELATANVLVSRSFDEPVAFERIQALEDAGLGCFQIHRVDFLRSYFSVDRKRMLCLYRAPDAESVRVTQQMAGMPVERVWGVRRFAP
jgi:hypothetical protein